MAAAAVTVVASVVSKLFAAHTARLADATNENQAADLLIPAFDADMKEINTLYNAGSITAAEAVSYLGEVVSNCETYLLKQVGKTGTAWLSVAATGAPNALPGPTCNKSCTVGCCLFWNNLRPAVYGVGVNAATGAVSAIAGKASGTPVGNNPHVSYVPEIYPPSDTAYGNYQRAAYTLTWTPPASGAAAKAVAATKAVTVSTPAPAQPTIAATGIAETTANATTASPSILSYLTNNTLVTLVGLVGGVIVIVAYLFGSDAVRIK